MNNEELLIIPNLYEIPSFVDEDVPFFYNITNDLYYYYKDGQWYTNNSNNENEIVFIFNGQVKATIDELRTAVSSFSIPDETQLVNIEISYQSNNLTILPRISDTSLDGVALLQFNNVAVGKIYPKIIFDKKWIPFYYHNAVELNKMFFNEVLVFEKGIYDGIENPYSWTVIFKDANGDVLNTESYTSWEDLRQGINDNTNGKIIEIKEG